MLPYEAFYIITDSKNNARGSLWTNLPAGRQATLPVRGKISPLLHHHEARPRDFLRG